MSTSMPSRETYVLDVPEVSDLRAEFKYGYFVPDEGSLDTGGVDPRYLSVPASDLSTAFLQRAQSRIPRMVVLRWTPPGNAPAAKTTRGLISSNMNRIVSETDASSYGYFTTTFNDVAHIDKYVALASGSVLTSLKNRSQGAYTSTNDAVKLLPDHIEGSRIIDALTQPSAAYGGQILTRKGVNTTSTERVPPGVTVTLNSKLAYEIIERCAADPMSQTGPELGALLTGSLRLKDAATRKALQGRDDKDNRLMVQPISVMVGNGSPSFTTTAEVVGYVIDKQEHLPTGETVTCSPIIVEGANVCETLDLRVKYGATYSYTVRTIALMKAPGIDATSGMLASLSFLVSSRSSDRQIVDCIEFKAPPAPTDIRPVWNYETDRLTITWDHPVNPQRDIKGFQVFRRRSINEPFELIKYLSFNDAVSKNAQTIHAVEPNIDATLVQALNDAATSVVDEEFNVRSRFIYTVCSIDAHGLTSNYGTQLEVSFDRFKNRINTRHVSCSGAPKAYPNMYLNEDAFVDTVRTSGGSNRALRVYLNPETFAVKYADGRTMRVLGTKQNNVRYVLQVINMDKQQMARVEVNVDDRTTDGTIVGHRQAQRRS